MFRLKVRESFAAGHYLPDHDGDCSNQHGHTWTVEVEVSAKNVGSGGMVVDFGDVKRAVRDVIALFDHTNLNDLPWFTIIPPTAENLTTVIWGEMVGRVDGKITAITVWESADACVRLERS